MSHIVKRIKQKIKQGFFTKRAVDFIICGTQKGGTSALDAYLREHPEICMADVKEIHFFLEHGAIEKCRRFFFLGSNK
jgi:hypothetical protein